MTCETVIEMIEDIRDRMGEDVTLDDTRCREALTLALSYLYKLDEAQARADLPAEGFQKLHVCIGQHPYNHRVLVGQKGPLLRGVRDLYITYPMKRWPLLHMEVSQFSVEYEPGPHTYPLDATTTHVKWMREEGFFTRPDDATDASSSTPVS